MSSYANLATISKYVDVSSKEEQAHLLCNVLDTSATTTTTTITAANRIHLIVSKDCSTRKIVYHDDYKKLICDLVHPHQFSVCLTYELVHKFVLDIDCLGCKELQKDDEATDRVCQNKGGKDIIRIFRCVEQTLKNTLGIETVGRVFITRGKTHGYHAIFDDINVDRCAYRYLCHKIGEQLEMKDDDDKMKFVLDEGCTSFVLPFGRGHVKCYEYSDSVANITACEDIVPEKLSPLPQNVFPFYSLKFSTSKGDDTLSCELLTTLTYDEIVQLRIRNPPKMKSYFYVNTNLRVYDRKSFDEYKDNLRNGIAPWALIRIKQTYAMWMAQNPFTDNHANLEKPHKDEHFNNDMEVCKDVTATKQKHHKRFAYFDRNADEKNAQAGFFDDSEIEKRKYFRVMAGSFTRLNNDGKRTATRNYVLLENFANVRNVIYKDDIMPRHIWNTILIEYFDSEINGNAFVLAAMKYISTNQSVFEDCQNFSDDQKLHIINQIIVNCSTYSFITGIVNDIYGTYKKILSKITDISLSATTNQMGSPYYDNEVDTRDVYNFAFRGREVVDESRFDAIKSKNYDIFVFCASLIYYHGDQMKTDAVRYYLFYYNYVNEDTLNKILSEYVDCNVMISLVFQTACARFTSDEKITLTTPAEMFRSEFKQLCYETDVNDEDDEDDDDNTISSEYDNIDEMGAKGAAFVDNFVATENTRKRKNAARGDMGGGVGGSNNAAKRRRRKKKKKICSRELIKTLKKYFWRPFTLNGIAYMYNGNEYENASSTYKMICDTLKCTQSAFQDIFNAKKFEQHHGRNFLYNTNFYYSSIKVPALFNVVLKIRETACGGINSLLYRSYLTTRAPERSCIDVYDLVVDGLNAIEDMENDINASSLRFLLTQPLVPLKVEEDDAIKQLLEHKEYGYVSINVKDYNKCLDVLEKDKHPAIDSLLNEIVNLANGDRNVEKYCRDFAAVNCLIQILLVFTLNTTMALNEDNLDVYQIIKALFGKDGAGQVGWNLFERQPQSRRGTTNDNGDDAVTTSTKRGSGTLVPVFHQHTSPDEIYTQTHLNEDAKLLTGVIDLKTRIRWIFNRHRRWRDATNDTEETVAEQKPVYDKIVHSISEQFTTLFLNQTNTNAGGDNDDNNNADGVTTNFEDDFQYRPFNAKDQRDGGGNVNRRRKAQMLFKLDTLAADSVLREKFLLLVRCFNDDAKVASMCRHAAKNVSKLPFRLKLACFLITVHFFKRLPNWKLKDLPCYKQNLSSSTNMLENNVDEETLIIPNGLLNMIKEARCRVLVWLYRIADERVPFDFFTGSQNEHRDDILKRYICQHPAKYRRAYELLTSHEDGREEQVKFESVLLTLTYLYYMSSFDVDTLILILKLILSIEFPGQWLKLCVILCGHRHAGKSKLLDILTEYSKSSASFKEPSDSNKENQPGFLLYISNMILIQDEIATLSNNFKKVISESKIDFRNNMGNVFASIYALSKLWYTCNSLPPCPYDSAVIDRILHIMVDFWHEEITNDEVAQFRYFTQQERERIRRFSVVNDKRICSEQIVKNEGSLPFMFLQKETKIFIASMINESAIKTGLYYISVFFSWFHFVKSIHKPVDIDIKNLPSLPNKWRQQWLTQTNLYFKWKNEVKITVQDGSDNKVSADLLMSSLKKYGENYNTSNQLINTFNEEFGRYFNKKDNTYTVNIDMNKIL